MRLVMPTIVAVIFAVAMLLLINNTLVKLAGRW